MAGAGAMPPGGLSVVSDYGEHGSDCGYCGSKRSTSWSHGMMADTLSVEAYQELLDRGWRRSGRWVYFPLQERSCCQLYTIRLDCTRFTPNKEQRRVERRWQAYLEGAPLRSEQQPQQQQGQQEQQQATQAAAGQAGGVGSPSRAVAGGSPKRSHEDIADAVQWGAPPGQSGAGQEQQTADGGGGKRSRRVRGSASRDGEGPDGQEKEGEQRPPRGASPTSRLSEHLQQALRSGSVQLDGAPLAQPAAQQGPSGSHQQQQQVEEAPAVSGEELLASVLSAAVQRAVSAGLLPAASYTAPKVQQPSARQRKMLPAGVTHTTAFPLAAAAAASKALAASGGGANAEQVAALLLQQLPPELAAAGQAVNGHLNFSLPQHAAGQRQPQQQQQLAAGQAAAEAAGAPLARDAAAAQASPAVAVPRGMPRHFELRTLPSSDPSIVQTEFALFKKYQVVHHNDAPSDVTHHSFRRFLVDSPLPHVGPEQYPPGGCPPVGFGSFHQQYILDGRLVAVGVVDVLPRCLSSKYLFWEPDMAPLSLGKLTSLLEIEWVRAAQRSCPSLRHYYMGFYIHNCHRMRYKGDFAPSDILCPRNKCWVPLERVQDHLDQPGMIAISEQPGALDGLDASFLVDPATRRPACPPRQPTDAELAACKLVIPLPGPGRQKSARVVTLGQLQGMLADGGDSVGEEMGKWWSRAGPAAAALIAMRIG